MSITSHSNALSAVLSLKILLMKHSDGQVHCYIILVPPSVVVSWRRNPHMKGMIYQQLVHKLAFRYTVFILYVNDERYSL